MIWRILLLTLCTVCASAQTVEVGVFTLFYPTRLEIRPASSSALLVTAEHARLILTGEPGHSVATADLTPAHLALNSSPTRSITVAARDDTPADFILTIPGKITRRYHGILRISTDATQLILVVSMDIETATASVVAAESPPGAPIEALKAQAVAARSFLYAAGRRHREYEFCDTTHCQFLREPPPAGSSAFTAALATRGLILTWRGKPLSALYSSYCKGRTASLHDAGITPTGYPYFTVPCTWCRRHPGMSARAMGYAASENFKAVGMCQYGAAGMAAEGAEFSAILRHYYPETQLMGIRPAQSRQR